VTTVQNNLESILEQISDEGKSAMFNCNIPESVEKHISVRLPSQSQGCHLPQLTSCDKVLWESLTRCGVRLTAASVVQVHLQQMREPEYFEPMRNKSMESSDKLDYLHHSCRDIEEHLEDLMMANAQLLHSFPDAKMRKRCGQMAMNFRTASIRFICLLHTLDLLSNISMHAIRVPLCILNN